MVKRAALSIARRPKGGPAPDSDNATRRRVAAQSWSPNMRHLSRLGSLWLTWARTGIDAPNDAFVSMFERMLASVQFK
jgi:hypothetical protein